MRLSAVLLSFLVLCAVVVGVLAHHNSRPLSGSSHIAKYDDKYLGIGSAATCDSKVRKAMWAAVQNNTKLTDAAAGFAKASEIDVLNKSLFSGDPPFVTDVIWSFNDTGTCESEVQKEVQHLDNDYHTSMLHDCIQAHFGGVPFGRACLMRVYACKAVKGGSDEQAFRIEVATHFHDDAAKQRIQNAGVGAVASVIRSVCGQ